MSVEYADEALVDLTDALEFLVEASPAPAEAFIDRVTAVVERLDDHAFDGPVEKLSNGERVQSWPVYPFRVYYQRRGDVLYVLRVYHQARAPIVKRPAKRKAPSSKR